MTTCIIYNPSAGSAREVHALRDAWAALPHTVVRRTEHARHARALAAMAARAGFGLVVAAGGGDGTTHEVASGLLDVAQPDVTLGINVDGELKSNAPITFTCRPGALRVIAGPNYRADVGEPTAT